MAGHITESELKRRIERGRGVGVVSESPHAPIAPEVRHKFCLHPLGYRRKRAEGGHIMEKVSAVMHIGEKAIFSRSPRQGRAKDRRRERQLERQGHTVTVRTDTQVIGAIPFSR